MPNPKAWGTHTGACKSCGYEMDGKKICAGCGAMYRKDGTYYEANKQGETKNATKSHEKSHNVDEKENDQKSHKATTESHKSHEEKATKSHKKSGGIFGAIGEFLNTDVC